MSPISDRIEALAELHCIDVLTLQEWFLERASIREFDAGIPRAKAEQLALQDVEDELNARPHGNRPTTTRALSRAHSGSEGPREED